MICLCDHKAKRERINKNLPQLLPPPHPTENRFIYVKECVTTPNRPNLSTETAGAGKFHQLPMSVEVKNR